MGMMIDGKWDTNADARTLEDGRFIRKDSAFRSRITAEGDGGFKAEAGRYHLYVAYNCPWAHRTLIFRTLKGLEAAISVSIAIPNGRPNGWEFGDDPGATRDAVNGFTYLHQAYAATDPAYTGSVTVPVLWDKRRGVIVNNESAEIVRMLNSAFRGVAGNDDEYYPAALRAEIDRINDAVYRGINNGVYRCGFARTQAAYEEAFDLLFATLDEMEARLARRRYLVGDRPTEADWRLFCTLVRFDVVYNPLFKCNERTIASYPNLSNYLRELYQWPGIAETVVFPHIIRGYYAIRFVNPTGIIPKGPRDPAAALRAPQDRAPKAAAA